MLKFNQVLILTIVFLVYCLIGDYVFNFHLRSYYSILADGFISGKLHLPIPVPEELLKLVDPYDPTENAPVRQMGYQDISYYKEKFYLYFGATPALLLHLPLYFFTKLQLSDALAIIIFLIGSLYFSILTLDFLRKKIFNNVSEEMINWSAIIIAFSNLSPYLIHTASFYNIAIVCGSFCNIGAIYFFCRGMLEELSREKYLMLGSIFLGLAIGCRPYFIVTGCAVLLFVWFYLSKKEKISFNYKIYAKLFLPFLFILLLQLLYNYARFDDIIEFGKRYQLTNWNSNTNEVVKESLTENIKWLYSIDIENFLSNVKYYLLVPPLIKEQFPHFYLTWWTTPQPVSKIFPAKFMEPIVGIIPSFPFILLTILIPCLRFLSFNSLKYEKKINFDLFPFALIFLIPFFINLYFLMGRYFVTLRYSGDYLNIIMVYACVTWFYFNDKSENIKEKIVLNRLALISGIISIAIGLSYGIQRI